MNTIRDVLKIILISVFISAIITSLILIQRKFDSLNEHLAAKDQIISELRYQLLNCKLTTLIEMEEKKNDQERTD